MRIGLLADATGVSAKTLRYWEAEGLLHDPDRTPGGYRDYPPGTVERVTFIRQAQGAGLTLRQIREIIAVREEGLAPCEHTAGLVDRRLDEVEQRLRELSQTRTELRELRRRLSALDPAECDPALVCSAIAPQAS